MSRVTTRRPMTRIAADGVIRRPDTLAVEEPLELRVNGEPLTVTMRTPGNDVDLAHGFLSSERIIESSADIVSARYCADAADDGANTYNVLDIRLRTTGRIKGRSFLTNSACGLCGKTAIHEISSRMEFLAPPTAPVIEAGTLAALPGELRKRQKAFAVTGGLHGAGLFDTGGAALVTREDVGRHNAVDKVIGWALRENRIPATELVLMVSSRASFELVQKAVMARIPILAAVSAPSSLAVDLADQAGVTLVGFLRGGTMNVYTTPQRIAVTVSG
ncbi:formate dehydrogenase accessory sulfurtransferase FdhD [Nocardia africana]